MAVLNVANFIGQMKISTKVISLACIALVTISAISGIFFWSEYSKIQSDADLEKIQISANYEKIIDVSSLEIRRREKDFIARQDEKYLDLWAEEMVVLEGNIADLEKTLSSVDDKKALQRALELINVYEVQFKRVGFLVAEIGKDENSGLHGEMRAAVHRVEQILQAANESELTAHMLMLRRHEKDFISRGDEKYAAQLAVGVEKFKSTLIGAVLDANDRDQILQNLLVYDQKFSELAEKQSELILTIADLSTLFAAFKPELDAVFGRLAERRAAKLAEIDARTTLTRLIAIGLLAFALVGITSASLLIGRSVARSMAAVTQSMQRLANDDLDIEVGQQNPNTEMGQMNAAIQVFLDNAIAVTEHAKEERERQRELARRAKLMEEVQLSIGNVVGAAAAGDFSQRVDADASDADMIKIVCAVNTLVDNVDRGLGETKDVLKALSNTDLTKRMSGNYSGAFDELSQSINSVADRFSNIVTELRSTSLGLKTATSEIAAGTDDLADRTTRQASSIEETSATLEQMADMVSSNAKEATAANASFSEMKMIAEKGGTRMQEATSAMEKISESSDKIADIIGMIDGIAFQTNLLALNASVEAARAGEAGEGFAVVAVEVRRLAQSTAEASTEIKNLIERSIAEIKEGKDLVINAGESLSQIEKSVAAAAGQMNSIAMQSNSQATAIDEINAAVRDLDHATQQNAALVEETNAATVQTESEAIRLDDIVAQFRLTDDAPRLSESEEWEEVA